MDIYYPISSVVLQGLSCSYWLTYVKSTYISNSHLCFLTPVSWCSYRRGKSNIGKQYFWASRLEKKHSKSASNHKYQANNQNNTTFPLSTLMCDWQYEACYQLAWVPVTSWLLLSLSLHMMSHLASTTSEAERSVFENTHTHSSQTLIAWLSSNVRWWSTSQRGGNMLSRTALEGFTSWSTSSHQDSVMLGKITPTSNCFHFASTIRPDTQTMLWQAVRLISFYFF